MLAVLAAEDARLDAGSVGLALARRWSSHGEPVLLVDADTTGSRLAERFGAAMRAEYSPALRGMASLIVAREPLNLKSLADHCYSLDDSQGSLWSLFAPFDVSACRYAADWLAERVGDLAAVDRQRRVLVSACLPSGAESLMPLLQSCAAAVVVAPAETQESVAALWAMCRDAGLMGFDRGHRLLIVEGSSPLDDDEIRVEAGMHVAGRLPVVEAERLMRLQSGRRDRSLVREVDQIVTRVKSLLSLSADSGSGGPDGADRLAGYDGRLGAGDGPLGPAASNGAGLASVEPGVSASSPNGAGDATAVSHEIGVREKGV